MFLGHMSKDQSKCMLKTTLPLTTYMDSSFFYKYPPSRGEKNHTRIEEGASWES
jgi:hypothetical protein